RLLHWPHEKTGWEKNDARDQSCLLSIAIMALLLTDADAKRRSSAQGSQAAGAKGSWCAVHPRHGGENCGYTSFDQCWATIGGKGAFADPIRSVSGHAFRDRLHLVRSEALELRRPAMTTALPRSISSVISVVQASWRKQSC